MADAYAFIYRKLKGLETAVSFLQSLLKPETGELRARATFHEQMAESFNLDELRVICFELDVRFEDLPGETVSVKALELYQFLERRGDLYRLAAVCQPQRPEGNWVIT